MTDELELVFCAETVQRMTVIPMIANKFNKYMAEHKAKSIDDRFGVRARLAVFIFDIKPSAQFRAIYRHEYYDIHRYEYEVPCQKEIEELVSTYGWVQFLKALEWFAVNRLKVYMQLGKVVYKIDQVSKFVEKVRAIPKWLK